MLAAVVERWESRAMLAANQAPVNHVPLAAQQAQVDLSFVGTIETNNSALRWISYRPESGFTGEAAFTITTNDLGNVGTGGAKTDTDVITINVNPVSAFAPSPAYKTLSGVLDTSLNGTGKQVLSLTEGIDYIHDMKVMPDGRIFAVGALNDRFGLMRFNADMTLNESFGTGGMTISDVGAGVHARSFVSDSSGRIVVVGGNRVARYSADGLIDSTFGTNGIMAIDHVGQAYAVAIQADGRVVVAGRDDYRFCVTRLTSNGAATSNWEYEAGLDDHWGDGGFGRVIFPLADGGLIVAGRAGRYYDSSDQFGVIRTNEGGAQE